MNTSKETIEKENNYKALLLYVLVGGSCLINLINYMENIKFNNELQKQIKLCKKMIEKNKNFKVET